MQKGNYCNSVQTIDATLIQKEKERKKEDVYSDNKRLIELAQGEDRDVADAASEELVKLNLGLVRSIALRFRDRGVELEDLIQIGTMGLLKAIRSFDLDRGTCFSTYAVPLIFGELRRYMRDEGPIKIGRYYKKLGALVVNAKNRIMADEGRDPTVGELAMICGVSVEEAVMALEAMSPIVSLSDSAFGEDEGVELSSVIPDEESAREMERLCDSITIREAMSKMPEQWQKIVALRYYRNMTQQRTAEILGITQVKVSREEKKIIEFFRSYFI